MELFLITWLMRRGRSGALYITPWLPQGNYCASKRWNMYHQTGRIGDEAAERRAVTPDSSRFGCEYSRCFKYIWHFRFVLKWGPSCCRIWYDRCTKKKSNKCPTRRMQIFLRNSRILHNDHLLSSRYSRRHPVKVTTLFSRWSDQLSGCSAADEPCSGDPSWLHCSQRHPDNPVMLLCDRGSCSSSCYFSRTFSCNL